MIAIVRDAVSPTDVDSMTMTSRKQTRDDSSLGKRFDASWCNFDAFVFGRVKDDFIKVIQTRPYTREGLSVMRL